MEVLVMRWLTIRSGAAVVGSCVAGLLAPAGAGAAADVRVTDDADAGSYVRYDGGTD
jgi:hypothetical protein